VRLLLSMGVSEAVGAPLQPRLRALDTATGAISDVFRWTPTRHPPGEHAELTGARWDGAALMVCSRTEVLWLTWPGPVVARVLTHPLMHDVHAAVRLPDGAVAVASTGIDSVLRFEGDALVAHTWLQPWPHPPRPADDDLARAFGLPRDLRLVPPDTFKPHRVHPNHLEPEGDRLWVTGLADRSRRLLGTGEGHLLPSPPHDGRRLAGATWLTTIDGHLLRDDGATRTSLDVAALEGAGGLPGWCRAVEVVGDVVYVGFSALRASRLRELARVAARGRAGVKQPTRVLAIHWPTRSLIGAWPVGGPGGGTIYSIVADHGVVTGPPTADP
jgi:hypothetical protein